MNKKYVRYHVVSGKGGIHLGASKEIALYVDAAEPTRIDEAAVCAWASTNFEPSDLQEPFVIISGPEIIEANEDQVLRLESSNHLIPRSYCIK